MNMWKKRNSPFASDRSRLKLVSVSPHRLPLIKSLPAPLIESLYMSLWFNTPIPMRISAQLGEHLGEYTAGTQKDSVAAKRLLSSEDNVWVAGFVHLPLCQGTAYTGEHCG